MLFCVCANFYFYVCVLLILGGLHYFLEIGSHHQLVNPNSHHWMYQFTLMTRLHNLSFCWLITLRVGDCVNAYIYQ